MAEFDDNSAGTIAVAVVTRGTERGAGVPCVADQWCLPRVALAWPASPDVGTWNTPGLCAAAGTSLPAQGQHFAADQHVLPNETGGGATAPDAWISRNMRPTEWWVVVDTCLDPTPGLLWSGVPGADLFDLSGLVVRKRAAWGSVHDLSGLQLVQHPMKRMLHGIGSFVASLPALAGRRRDAGQRRHGHITLLAGVGGLMADYAWREAQWEELRSAIRASVSAAGSLVGSTDPGTVAAIENRVGAFLPGLLPGMSVDDVTVSHDAGTKRDDGYGGRRIPRSRRS